jgi:peptidoglycan/LPS O-acetylase OafA/YrhL
MARLHRSFAELSEGQANNFDFFRFVLACVVIVTHSFVFMRTNLTEPLTALTGDQMSLGRCAVYGFFVMSGFLITASWFRSRGPRDYATKRILRIYPAFLVCCAICVLLVEPLGELDVAAYFEGMNWSHFAKNTLLLNKIELPDIGPIPFGLDERQVNGSLWTIKIEFECYVVLALLGIAGFLRRPSVMAIALLIAWAFPLYPALIARSQLASLLRHFEVHFLFLTCFLFGTLFYVLRTRIAHDVRLALLAVLLLVVAATTGTGSFLFPPALAYGLLYLAFHPRIHQHGFAAKRDLSYGVYLYGWPIQFIAAGIIGRRMNPYLFALLCIPVVCGCAFLSWTFIEAPALRLRSRTAYRAAPQPVDTYGS